MFSRVLGCFEIWVSEKKKCGFWCFQGCGLGMGLRFYYFSSVILSEAYCEFVKFEGEKLRSGVRA